MLCLCSSPVTIRGPVGSFTCDVFIKRCPIFYLAYFDFLHFPAFIDFSWIYSGFGRISAHRAGQVEVSQMPPGGAAPHSQRRRVPLQSPISGQPGCPSAEPICIDWLRVAEGQTGDLAGGTPSESVFLGTRSRPLQAPHQRHR
jgi:hypothetical protein